MLFGMSFLSLLKALYEFLLQRIPVVGWAICFL